jgi:hypothetical protein
LVLVPVQSGRMQPGFLGQSGNRAAGVQQKKTCQPMSESQKLPSRQHRWNHDAPWMRCLLSALQGGRDAAHTCARSRLMLASHTSWMGCASAQSPFAVGTATAGRCMLDLSRHRCVLMRKRRLVTRHSFFLSQHSLKCRHKNTACLFKSVSRKRRVSASQAPELPQCGGWYTCREQLDRSIVQRSPLQVAT